MIDVTNWKQTAIMILWMFLEAWLGKTEKTKYSSTLELVVFGSVSLIKKIFTKGEKNEGR
jgi:hypothetical protein